LYAGQLNSIYEGRFLGSCSLTVKPWVTAINRAVIYRFDCNLAFTNIRKKVFPEGTATKANTGNTYQQNCPITIDQLGQSSYFGSLILWSLQATPHDRQGIIANVPILKTAILSKITNFKLMNSTSAYQQ